MSKPPDPGLTADDITKYLDTRDDFALELSAYRLLKEHDWVVHHGGMYPDPLQKKLRQRDLRATKPFHLNRTIDLAVECKNLSTQKPLLVSRVPCPSAEAYHEVIEIRRPPGGFVPVCEVKRSSLARPKLLAPQQMIGKSLAQPSKNSGSNDFETHDKWTQAVASASEMVGARANTLPDTSSHVFVLPVLLVADGTLWTVDYDARGERSPPQLAADAFYFLDRHAVISAIPPWRVSSAYQLNLLFICTINGFASFLNALDDASGRHLERIFAFTTPV